MASLISGSLLFFCPGLVPCNRQLTSVGFPLLGSFLAIDDANIRFLALKGSVMANKEKIKNKKGHSLRAEILTAVPQLRFHPTPRGFPRAEFQDFYDKRCSFAEKLSP